MGFLKTSLVDFPGKLASVIFFPGCNLRCPWCHNAPLALGEEEGLYELGACLQAIGKRRHIVGGVAVTGGEPLLSNHVGSCIQAVHEMGLPLKLDSNGTFPERLAALVRNGKAKPDFIALDVKAGASRYGRLHAEGWNAADSVRRSIEILIDSGIEFEIRTVVAPGFFDEEAVEEWAPLVPPQVPWYFSAFVPGACLDESWNDIASPSGSEVAALADRAREFGKDARVR